MAHANPRRLTDAEILAQIPAAEARVREEALIEPRAASARYDAETGRILVELTSGCIFGFLPSEADLPASATAQELAAVEVDLAGEGLHWEEIYADVSVPGIIAQRLNLAAWAPKFMDQRTSEAESAAARANGQRRPRLRRHL